MPAVFGAELDGTAAADDRTVSSGTATTPRVSGVATVPAAIIELTMSLKLKAA